MTDDVQGREAAPSPKIGEAGVTGRGRGKRLRLVLIAMALVLALLIVPPWISIGRYKNRITQVISQSLGRPVRLASVELRLLPWPGFVLSDLSVAEDPGYGAEPVLHANTVTANIRLLSLWQGKLEISSVSVDEASLNVVRAAPGRWNLDPLFRTAAAKAGSTGGGQAHRFPYLEATNSRINFKNGAEKLPFSLVNTDLSFWQESPNEWRVRLRGQPARTDVTLDLADTGMVRLEASIHRASGLRLMPLSVDLDWRQAQLGQLSRLLIGYDPGWRGDLTGELHLEGTPDAARVTARLSATGVHRAEFAPASPLDFDANCRFVYHYSRRALDGLTCNSPLGDGRLQLSGDWPGNGPPNLTLDVDRISVGAGLDVLRTLRSGIDPDLQASGTVRGKLVYAGEQPGEPETKAATSTKARRVNAAAQRPLTGSLTVEGFALSGAGLDQPLRAPKVVLEPVMLGAAAANGEAQRPQALAGTAVIPAGGAAPLNVNVKLALYGYEVGLHGQFSMARARELAQMLGPAGTAVLQGLGGESLTANLIADGPWPPSEGVPSSAPPVAIPASTATPQPMAGEPPAAGVKPPAKAQLSEFDSGIKPAGDNVVGTITLRNANWRSDYLANHVEIADATLHLGDGALRWNPVMFSYGPVKGTASVTLPGNCAAAEAGTAAEPGASCQPQFEVQFSTLDAEAVQAAFLGARQKGTLLSDLLNRLHPTMSPPWPAMQGTVKADALAIGPVTLRQATAQVRIAGEGAEIRGLTAAVLGGQIKARGTVEWSGSDRSAPEYSVTADFDRLSAAAVGKLLGLHWSGGPINGDGKIDLSGFTGRDLAASASGTLHFEWRRGNMAAPGARTRGAAARGAAPPLVAHFDSWSGEAQIGDGAITLGQNQLVASARKLAIEGAVKFDKPPKVRFAARQPGPVKRPAATNQGSRQ